TKKLARHRTRQCVIEDLSERAAYHRVVRRIDAPALHGNMRVLKVDHVLPGVGLRVAVGADAEQIADALVGDDIDAIERQAARLRIRGPDERAGHRGDGGEAHQTKGRSHDDTY